VTGLLTDLYELTMAAGYWRTGKVAERATFELSIRRLPVNRSYVILAGVEQAIEYLLGLRYTTDEIRYLRGLGPFSAIGKGFWEYLRAFRFTGDVWAIREGTPVFAGEPVLRVTAPLVEAQIPETYLLAAVTFQSLIATKASRAVEAARGRAVIEFGTRRAHTAEAGVLGARAAYIGGCLGTSNVEAGYRFGIPVYGTAAHSWVLAFDTEREAFARLHEALGAHTIYLVDTYDTEQGVRNATSIGGSFWGIRLDSGDFLAESRLARAILDEAGCREARIMASGDLNEYRIAELLGAGAPIDAFGVGTELATSADAPTMGTIYKLVEIERGGLVRPAAKFSPSKPSWPGSKQVFRYPDHDVIGLADEEHPGSVPLLQPVLRAGKRVGPPESLEDARKRAGQPVRLRSVVRSERLEALAAQVRQALSWKHDSD
jgi:nicotinate phosphoribosyltransferase